MRSKYMVWSEDGEMVMGLRYDHSRLEFKVGGQFVNKDWMEEVVRVTFGVSIPEWVRQGSKCSAILRGPVDSSRWRVGIRRLKGRGTRIEHVQSFRRLMH